MLRSIFNTHTRLLSQIPKQAVTQASTIARYYSTGVNLDKEVEKITDLAMTAKDEMDFAEESRNSVYYNDDKLAAQEAVNDMSKAYDDLLASLSDADRKAIETRIGIKVKEILSAYEIMTLNDLED